VIKAVSRFISEHHLLRAGDRVGAAVSGGADSVALLRAFLELRAELGLVLAVVHFNHRIRGAESDADEQFVRQLAERFALPFLCGSADVPAWAREQGLGIEAAARRLRYEYFAELLDTPKAEHGNNVDAFPLDKIATAHTANDQAETVLMRLLRGAGTRGLGAIRASLGQRGIIRPLLGVTRKEITAYLECIQQPWREDSSNRHLDHTRNRVRHTLIPLIERDFNPAIVHILAEHAQIAQAEEEYGDFATEQALVAVSDPAPGPGPGLTVRTLRVDSLLKLPLALERRVIRAVAERAGLTLDFKHIEAVRHLAESHSGIKPHYIALPGGEAEVALRPGVHQGSPVRELVLRSAGLSKANPQERDLDRNKRPKSGRAREYEYRLAVPGSVEVREIGSLVRARLVNVAEMQSLVQQENVVLQEEGKTAFQRYNQPKLAGDTRLLDPRRVGTEVMVRNWRPGDRFWPAHTRSPKKVKELLQKVPEAERKGWPVIVSGSRIIWMRGLPPPEEFSVPSDARADVAGLLIDEKPLAAGY
jgi:tRNA(Ile)-lysidine synthase